MAEFEPNIESSTSSSPGPVAPTMSLQRAVELGEYDPAYLGTFAEWHQFSKTIQWRYIKQAIDTRIRNLTQQWAEVNNVLDFRNKPHLKVALKNIEDQMKKVEHDRERLLVEYSSV